MTTYRQFTTTATATEFVITEVEPTTSHPLNWYDTKTRQGAWEAARAQTLPVRFVGRDGTSTAYGPVFGPGAFERAAYRGYVAHGLSMTDGHFGPLTFEAWVTAFRAHPTLNDCDVPAAVAAAFPAYQASLAQV